MKTKLLMILITVTLLSCSKTDLKVCNLSCENRENPVNIEILTPMFGWQIQSEQRGIKQTAYRIRVAETQKDLKSGNPVWDSDVIESDATLYVQYKGKPLEKGKKYYWNVEIWDNKGQKSDVSTSAFFRISEYDTERKWIAWAPNNDTKTASVWYRKSIDVNAEPRNEIFAEISTPGYYELYINGEKVGTDVISPANTLKAVRTFCVTYNIAAFLKKGENTIGIWAGRGWNGTEAIPVHFKCKIDEKTIETDETWKASESPYFTIGTWWWGNFGGELYDARLHVENWNKPGFDDSKWASAIKVESPSPKIEAQQIPLNKITSLGKPKSIKKINDKYTEIDFGTNMTGWISLKMNNLKQGDTVKMYYADRKWKGASAEITPAGSVPASMNDMRTLDGNDTVRFTTYNQWDEFISAGKGEELFESKFNFHGFRHVLVEGCTSIDAEAFFIETDLKETGSFACSDTLINAIHELNHYTMRCLNLGGVYVDCQTRERLGYGDGQVATDGGNFNFDMHNYYIKFLNDWQLNQNKATGEFPTNSSPIKGGGGGPAWKGTTVFFPWKLYAYYNDTITLRKGYETIAKYCNYLDSQRTDGLLKASDDKWQFIGDWLAPGRGMDTDNWPYARMNELFNNCYSVLLWEKALQIAGILDMPDEAARCEKRADELRKIIHNEYYNANSNMYVIPEQPYYVMPLISGCVPAELEEKVFAALEKNIVENKGVQTGMLSTWFMSEYLIERDRADLLYLLFAHKRYPGWGYMLDQGATTIWEQWNGYWSQIHSCFTSADTWIYKGLAGIIPGAETDSKETFVFRPSPVGNLTTATATYQSIYGEAKIEWIAENGKLYTNITVPPNCTAEVQLPLCDVSEISESNVPADKAECVTFAGDNSKRIKYKTGSGKYNFVSKVK